jgi:hypothetical protein
MQNSYLGKAGRTLALHLIDCQPCQRYLLALLSSLSFDMLILVPFSALIQIASTTFQALARLPIVGGLLGKCQGLEPVTSHFP